MPGKDVENKASVTYFGQEYPSDIIKALGVLMIRANLLERDPTTLFATLSGLEFTKAKALFYSTNNSKARFDMIRSIAATSYIQTERLKELGELLDKANGVMLRRNHLIHGNWSFKDDKFEVGYFQPLSKPKQPVLVNAAHIEKLASDYRSAGMLIALFATQYAEKQTSP